MKKLLSIVLALVMALSAVSVTALAADDYADFDGTIALGETRPVNLPGLTQYSDYVFIRFIPEKSGWYALSSDSRGNDDCDPYVELYTNINSTYVAKNDDAHSETNEFYLEYYFEADKTYYFAMGNRRNATVWDITLECLHTSYKDGKCEFCGVECDHVKVENEFQSCPCGKTYSGDVITLTDGKFEANAKCEEAEYIYVKFAPEKTGIFRATSDSSAHKRNIPDPCCDVFDSQGNLIVSHDDISVVEDEENYDFDLVYQFEAGKVYFIGLWDYQAGKEWAFTFEDVSTHSFEVPVEEDDETTTPDDDAGAAVMSEDDTTTPEETPKTETVVHSLTFVPQVDASCMNAGCTGYAYCEECDDFEPIGKYDIEMYDHIYDEDGNCMTDGCDETDPVLSCSHMCHSKGIMSTIWAIVKFFTMIFNYNGGQFCECGEAHY
jgi:hypothetical protein